MWGKMLEKEGVRVKQWRMVMLIGRNRENSQHSTHLNPQDFPMQRILIIPFHTVNFLLTYRHREHILSPNSLTLVWNGSCAQVLLLLRGILGGPVGMNVSDQKPSIIMAGKWVDSTCSSFHIYQKALYVLFPSYAVRPNHGRNWWEVKGTNLDLQGHSECW